jgi:ADP-heptose:LPS heptosyltransferase
MSINWERVRKRTEKKIKVSFFYLVRIFLKRGRSLSQIDSKQVQRVLLLRPESKLGDMVISLPVVDNLRRLFPHISVSILCSPRNAILIDADSRFAAIYRYNKNLWQDFQMMRQVKAQKFDCVIDLLINDSVTALVMSQLCGKQAIRIGAGKHEYAKYYDFHLDVPLENEDQIIISTLKALYPFGVKPEQLDGYSQVFTGKESDANAARFLSSLSLDSSKKLIGHNISAGSANRVWEIERSRELIRRILNNYPDSQVIVFTAPSERHRGEAIVEGFDPRVALVPPKLSILDVAAIIRKLGLLISPDTSLVHIARGFKVPVVALMPNKTLRRWRPFGQEQGMVVCKTGDHIHDITVDEVFSMTQTMLSKSTEMVRP